MANIQHNAIPNADLHEPKGASGAASGTVYVADGANSGQWTKDLFGGVQVGGGTLLTKIAIYTPGLNPTTVSVNGSAQDFVVVGLTTADKILSISKPTLTPGIFIAGASVPSVDTLRIVFFLPGGPIDLPAETYTVVAFRS